MMTYEWRSLFKLLIYINIEKKRGVDRFFFHIVFPQRFKMHSSLVSHHSYIII